jgi:hypothetical protein
MNFTPKSDHKRASLSLYLIVAINSENKLGHTINKAEAASILADLLHIDRRSPASWLRGNFKKHPLSRENFLRLVRTYRKKPGLENAHKVSELAREIYGSEYQRAIDLLDPGDREGRFPQNITAALPGEAQVVMEICNLLESNPEAIEIALGAMTTYQWTAGVLLEKLRELPNNTGMGKIIQVTLSQIPNNIYVAFSKLGGLPELALYNLDCFEMLWEKTGSELDETLTLLEGLNLIRTGQENEWKIKPQVLSIARQYLEALPEGLQLRARRWWRRLLHKPKYLQAFRSHLISSREKSDRSTVEKSKEKRKPFPSLLSRWIFGRIDTDWNDMLSLSPYMSYENFVFAQFLLMRRKRNFLFGFLISLWFGATSLIHHAPLPIISAIGAGIYAFMQLIIDLYRCDRAWEDLRETLVTRSKSVPDSG